MHGLARSAHCKWGPCSSKPSVAKPSTTLIEVTGRWHEWCGELAGSLQVFHAEFVVSLMRMVQASRCYRLAAQPLACQMLYPMKWWVRVLGEQVPGMPISRTESHPPRRAKCQSSKFGNNCDWFLFRLSSYLQIAIGLLPCQTMRPHPLSSPCIATTTGGCSDGCVANWAMHTRRQI